MSNYSRLLDLAAQIQASTDTVDKYLKDHNLPAPSFHEDGPVDFGLNEEAPKALETAKTSSLELFDLLQGPAVALRPVYNGVSLQAIYRYDIASKVPINGKISYQDLSAKCGLSVINLQRILRFAMVWNRCFTEPRKGFVAHSAASRVLVANPKARSGLGFMFDECWQVFAHTLDAVRDYGETEDVAKTQRCISIIPSIFSGQDPWDSVTKVVDVGGAQGHISIELAQTYPNLKFVLQDLPDVVERIEKTLPKNVKDRIEIMGHDFFIDQPVQADAYLFSQIFHDWPEAHCIKILRALIPQLIPGARVICYDHLLPEPGTIPLPREQAARGMDMIMVSLFNSRERDADDWATLFQAADPRFGKPKSWIPEGSNLGII
ncbi:hypothetical protein BCON_0050g00320 [Botryotinia convoluta]|uniref:O-methyltransferase C-terminal domain-containing protein n=1 Tax=Botryotinia convoluta TaxID=54673 RepID=A0A4Z1II98_9HELO|nr:hypothetical protein BCON_0050g00320 [Botryotinia convoluta]